MSDAPDTDEGDAGGTSDAGGESHAGGEPPATGSLGPDEALLALEDVTAGYGNTTVIHDVSIGVGDGEIACLIGPNGSGKSTLMKAVYGFADVFSGRVTLGGTDVTGRSPQASLRSGMSYVLQDASVFPDMTVHENMLMGGYVFEDDDRATDRAEELYEEFGLLGDVRAQKAGSLSGGQRRILEFARALMVEPEVMLLDEPSIGLEPRYIEQVFDRIRQVNDLGTTILLVEQNAQKGLSVADRGFVLASGEIKVTGTGTELLDDEAVGRLYLGG